MKERKKNKEISRTTLRSQEVKEGTPSEDLENSTLNLSVESRILLMIMIKVTEKKKDVKHSGNQHYKHCKLKGITPENCKRS